jgi:hypothetical protein
VPRLATVALLSAWCSAAAASTALRPVVTTHGSYGESFTFIADLDDGGYVHLSLGFTNIGPGSLKAICRAVVIPAIGSPWQASKRVGGDAWSWSGGGGEELDRERLAIDACVATVAPASTQVEIPLEGGLVRLRLAAPAERRAAPDAAFGTSERSYRSDILLYRTRLEATIQLPGAAPRTVGGAGYLDHTRSTIKPKELAAQWVRFRALRGERGLVLLARRGHDGQVGPAWACDPPGRCRHYATFTLDRTGEDRSTAFRIMFPSERDAIRIDSGRLLYRDDPIGELGLLGKVVAPYFGAPVTYTFRARLQDAQGPAIDGILEVELAND